MLSRRLLITQINRKKSFLCLRLDTDIDTILAFLKEYSEPAFEFNIRIIAQASTLGKTYKQHSPFEA